SPPPKIHFKVLKNYSTFLSSRSVLTQEEKEMKLLPSLFKNIAPEPKSSSSSWPWPSCTQTRTISFRIPGNDMFKTINSAYFDTNTTPESFFTNSAGCASFSTEVSEEDSSGGGGGDPIETVINKGLRSERLFFEPGETSSILDKDSIKAHEEEDEDEDDDGVDDEDEPAAGESNIPFKESVALSMDSPDPYVDFRKSMEEMVEAHGLKDWEHLEELLGWYLRVNGKSNHGYIVGAFVDLLIGLAFSTTISPHPSSSCSHEYSPSTPLSFYNSTTSCSSSSTSTPYVSSIEPEEGSEMSTSTIPNLSCLLEAEEEINEDDDDGASS
ncbi:transcription repressor OFP13-like, partial [Argentina anserina]|uniref:transcription repressor OFP13-like n=1 Tax=Argentina anserina TaxID=57926 RepID=UPI0021767F97